MRKWLLALAFLLCFGTAYAGTDNKTILTATLDDSPVIATSDTVYIQDYKKVALVTKYDETSPYKTVSGVFSLQFSYDGTNYFNGYFNDWAGGSTLQTSETISSDGWYYAWLDSSTALPPYMKVSFYAINSTSQDTVELNTYIIGEK